MQSGSRQASASGKDHPNELSNQWDRKYVLCEGIAAFSESSLEWKIGFLFFTIAFVELLVRSSPFQASRQIRFWPLYEEAGH